MTEFKRVLNELGQDKFSYFKVEGALSYFEETLYSSDKGIIKAQQYLSILMGEHFSDLFLQYIEEIDLSKLINENDLDNTDAKKILEKINKFKFKNQFEYELKKRMIENPLAIIGIEQIITENPENQLMIFNRVDGKRMELSFDVRTAMRSAACIDQLIKYFLTDGIYGFSSEELEDYQGIRNEINDLIEKIKKDKVSASNEQQR